jgi:hypothetical protein
MAQGANNFTGKVDSWLTLTEIDYYIQFVKNWIPFNAWYMVNYYSEQDNRTKDRPILNYLKANSNTFKDRIVNLLNTNTEESIQFRKDIAELHLFLDSHSIPNHSSKISFKKTVIDRNSQSIATSTFRNWSFKVEFDSQAKKTTKRFKCQVFITKSQRPIFFEDFNDWSKTDLQLQTSFQQLNRDQQIKLLECVEEVNPSKSVNVVKDVVPNSQGVAHRPRNCIVMNESKNVYFVDDADLISRVLIELLYNLRCVLFHGEIDPTKTNQEAFKYGYRILTPLINTLR